MYSVLAEYKQCFGCEINILLLMSLHCTLTAFRANRKIASYLSTPVFCHAYILTAETNVYVYKTEITSDAYLYSQ